MAAPDRRREEIVQTISYAGAINVGELAARFEVTASTIRRDLAALHARGRLARTYGGAIGITAHPEESLRERTHEGHDEKRAIARWAAAQIHPGERLLLDAGSSIAALARELRFAHDLQIATVGLTVLDILADSIGIQLDGLGGHIRPLSQSFLGPLTEAALERLTFDRLFLSADGVTAARGVSQALMKQVVQNGVRGIHLSGLEWMNGAWGPAAWWRGLPSLVG